MIVTRQLETLIKVFRIFTKKEKKLSTAISEF